MSLAARTERHLCGYFTGTGPRTLRACTRTGKYEEDGKWYCRTHLPSEQRRRREASEARFAALQATYRHHMAVAEAESDVVAAAKAWQADPLEGHFVNTTRELASAVLRLIALEGRG